MTGHQSALRKRSDQVHFLLGTLSLQISAACSVTKCLAQTSMVPARKLSQCGSISQPDLHVIGTDTERQISEQLTADSSGLIARHAMCGRQVHTISASRQ